MRRSAIPRRVPRRAVGFPSKVISISDGARRVKRYPGLPGVDAGALALAAFAARRHRVEPGDDPPAGVGRVDDLVDLEVRGGVDRFALLVHLGDHGFVVGVARGGIGDRLELLAVAELDRALEAHRAELA